MSPIHINDVVTHGKTARMELLRKLRCSDVERERVLRSLERQRAEFRNGPLEREMRKYKEKLMKYTMRSVVPLVTSVGGNERQKWENGQRKGVDQVQRNAQARWKLVHERKNTLTTELDCRLLREVLELDETAAAPESVSAETGKGEAEDLSQKPTPRSSAQHREQGAPRGDDQQRQCSFARTVSSARYFKQRAPPDDDLQQCSSFALSRDKISRRSAPADSERNQTGKHDKVFRRIQSAKENDIRSKSISSKVHKPRHIIQFDDSLSLRECWAGDPEAIDSVRRPLVTSTEKELQRHLDRVMSTVSGIDVIRQKYIVRKPVEGAAITLYYPTRATALRQSYGGKKMSFKQRTLSLPAGGATNLNTGSEATCPRPLSAVTESTMKEVPAEQLTESSLTSATEGSEFSF